MTMKFLRIFLLTALAAFAALSCKKDEETEVEYMVGSIRLDFPTYVQPGYSQTFKLEDIMTVTRPDGGEVGYYYTDPFSGERDTLRTETGEVLRDSFEIVVEDTLANLTLSATAYGGDYVNTTGSKTFTVVKPGFDDDCSITGFSNDRRCPLDAPESCVGGCWRPFQGLRGDDSHIRPLLHLGGGAVGLS